MRDTERTVPFRKKDRIRLAGVERKLHRIESLLEEIADVLEFIKRVADED